MQTVGAFAVIFDSGANVLLCHRTDRDAWNLPGGRVEPGETPQEAVVREVLEEVGLQVRVERLLGVHPVPTQHDLVFTFLCVPVGGVLSISSEADRVAWFSRAKLPANTLPRHLERIEDAYEQRAR
jgi:8-oxo-dGTP diphosphatase